MVDVVVTEKDDAIFICTTSKIGASIKWCLENSELTDPKKYKIQTDGTEHRLTIFNCKFDDEGRYKAIVGARQTSGSLTVKGQKKVCDHKNIVKNQHVSHSEFLTSFNHQTEIPMEFLSPLSDKHAKENDDVCFQCQLNKPNQKARWMKDGREIMTEGRFETDVRGDNYYLRIAAVCLEDEGKYSCTIRNLRTDGKLYVEGNSKVAKFTLLRSNINEQISIFVRIKMRHNHGQKKNRTLLIFTITWCCF